MRPAADRDDYLANPVGRYLAGRTYLAFCAHEELCGVVLWGRPDGDDMSKLIVLLKRELSPPIRPHASMVDARRLEGVDSSAYELLTQYVEEHWEKLQGSVTRLALVRPAGLPGTVVAGFFQVLQAPYPVDVFAEPIDALPFLGARADEGLVRALDEAHASVAGVPHVVAVVRAALTKELGAATLPGIATTLGMSSRTLQRRLQEAGTTFQDQVNAAQVDAAKAMLLDSNAPLTAIAMDVGCASLQHFSALFRRLTGESPSGWRAQRRGATPG